MRHLVAQYKMSIAQACRALRLSRSTFYEPLEDWLERDWEIIEAVQ